jgi:hypothetical protein
MLTSDIRRQLHGAMVGFDRPLNYPAPGLARPKERPKILLMQYRKHLDERSLERE